NPSSRAAQRVAKQNKNSFPASPHANAVCCVGAARCAHAGRSAEGLGGGALWQPHKMKFGHACLKMSRNAPSRKHNLNGALSLRLTLSTNASSAFSAHPR